VCSSDLTIHPGYLSPVGKLLPESAWRNQKEALRRIGQVAAAHGVLACLENMIGIKEFLCQRPLELAGMTEGIEGIGITIDFGHANTVGQVDDFLPLLGSANHIHLHDNHGTSDEHLALGEGTIDWEKVGPAVRERYSGVTVVEGRSLEEAKKSMIQYRKWFL
jgi:sugar phosphate isomerase/epimerase